MLVSDLGYRGAVFFAGGGAGAGLTGRGGTGKLSGLRFMGNFRRWEMLTVPRYDYRCVECDNHFELRQSFSEAGTGACPECSGAGQRVYHAVPVIYKGSGFTPRITDAPSRRRRTGRARTARTGPSRPAMAARRRMRRRRPRRVRLARVPGAGSRCRPGRLRVRFGLVVSGGSPPP